MSTVFVCYILSLYTSLLPAMTANKTIRDAKPFASAWAHKRIVRGRLDGHLVNPKEMIEN